jgi:hypothetical protein
MSNKIILIFLGIISACFFVGCQTTTPLNNIHSHQIPNSNTYVYQAKKGKGSKVFFPPNERVFDRWIDWHVDPLQLSKTLVLDFDKQWYFTEIYIGNFTILPPNQTVPQKLRQQFDIVWKNYFDYYEQLNQVVFKGRAKSENYIYLGRDGLLIHKDSVNPDSIHFYFPAYQYITPEQLRQERSTSADSFHLYFRIYTILNVFFEVPLHKTQYNPDFRKTMTYSHKRQLYPEKEWAQKYANYNTFDSMTTIIFKIVYTDGTCDTLQTDTITKSLLNPNTNLMVFDINFKIPKNNRQIDSVIQLSRKFSKCHNAYTPNKASDYFIQHIFIPIEQNRLKNWSCFKDANFNLFPYTLLIAPNRKSLFTKPKPNLIMWLYEKAPHHLQE